MDRGRIGLEFCKHVGALFSLQPFTVAHPLLLGFWTPRVGLLRRDLEWRLPHPAGSGQNAARRISFLMVDPLLWHEFRFYV